MNQKLYNTWRSLLVFSSVLSVLAIIPATIDYEGSYIHERTFETCIRETFENYLNRWICLILSLASIVVVIPYRIYYLRWRRQSMLTYEELPALRVVSFQEIIDKCKPPSWTAIFDIQTLSLILMQLILPYPYLEESFSVS